jgi:pSer/pThr/pTyr-binding forkhead associated (FHA) protein
VRVLLLSDVDGTHRKLLTMTTILGRSEAAGFRVPDVYASPHHAIIAPIEDGWAIADLGSANGTWLNNLKVYGSSPLSRGDRIKIGHTVLIVVPVT